MAYDPDALLTKLGQDYEFDSKSAFALGWCNVLKADSRNMGHPVWIYFPLEEVWNDSGARRKLTAQFRDYDKSPVHECLPQAVEMLEGKQAAGGMALITSRFSEENLMEAERSEDGTSWPTRDTFGMPAKIGALRGVIQAASILHRAGFVHASIGFTTLLVSRANDRPLVRFDLLAFGDPEVEAPHFAPWFHAAFNAPETFSGGNRTPAADVYGLAKFLLYFLVGPERFMKLFGALSEEDVLDEEKTARLFDYTLWNNLAQDGPEPDAEAIKRATDSELSLELAELLRRAVVRTPSDRLRDAQVLYQGLETSMGSPGVPTPPVGGGGIGGGGGGSDGKTLKLVAAGFVVMVLLGGAWLFLERQAEKRLIADMNQSCRQFVGEYDQLQTSLIREMSGWEQVAEVHETIFRLRGDENRATEILNLCNEGQSEISTLKGQFVKVLKDRLARDIRLAREAGTDLGALNLDARAARAERFEDSREFEAFETEMRGQSEDVRKAHDEVLRNRLEGSLESLRAARGILGLSEPDAAEADLIGKIEAVLPAPPTPEALLEKTAVLDEANRFSRTRLSEAAGARVAALETLADGLEQDGAGAMSEDFASLDDRLRDLSVAPVPVTVEAATTYFREASAIEAGMRGLRTRLDEMAAEIDPLAGSVSDLLRRAEQRGWQELGDMPVLRERFERRPTQTIFAEWTALSDLEPLVEQEFAALSDQWAAGVATCTSLKQQVAANPDLTRTGIWRQMRRVMDEIDRLPDERLGSEEFAVCEEGLALVETGRMELRGLELLNEVMATRTALENDGLGPFLPEFSEAVSLTASLEAIAMPRSETEYALYSEQARKIFEQFDRAETAFAEATARNADLQRDHEAAAAGLRELGIESSAAYQEMTAALRPTESGNVLERNAALEHNLALMADLRARHEAGELLNCGFGALTLSGYHFTAEEIAAATELLPQGVRSGYAPARACISDRAVSVEDLMAYHDTLPVRDESIKREIRATQAGTDGAARNVSYWLAERYAEHMSETTGERICVPPALVTIMSAGQGTGELVPVSGELSGDLCGEDGPADRKLILYRKDDATYETGCVSVNRRQADMSFRLAGGEVCSP